MCLLQVQALDYKLLVQRRKRSIEGSEVLTGRIERVGCVERELWASYTAQAFTSDGQR